VEEEWEDRQAPQAYDYLPGEKWQIYIETTKVFKKVEETVRDYTALQHLPDIWNRYKRIHKEWFNEVNWDAMGKAMKLSSTQTKHWILKRSARDCGVHAILKRRKERDNDHCPFCQQEETVEHVYRCQHKNVQATWDNAMMELEQYLTEIHTDPNITNQLLDGLHIWRNNSYHAPSPMIVDQSNIGWSGILEGTLGRHWEDEQTHFAETNSSATSGRRWAHLVIRKLWKIAWEMWLHRNAQAHRNDSIETLQQSLQLVQQELDKGTQGYQELKHFFTSEEKERVLQGNLTYVTCWLRAVQSRRLRRTRHQAQSSEFNQMRNTLRQFLTLE
jgi:hypothetical protein